ncbi:tRNA-modifying protein ygfZ [Delftia tsuruhatensis]|uniref:CAF17-like 4Fe-4S cluster assembly/insertion protein YgfZ n=1 Tax=Delftia tsuruhatensis TaxID=180282 RepID=UPI001E77E2B1|nr:folate-binding protein [Delftia tsuruhatensis]CAB5720182.1 tRNA-modifying protein ygfZ [Delftia tsuruhatensis]CAC9685649.1 tRNA-modifying protein ygfZ [Delftia tsuruhatensis]
MTQPLLNGIAPVSHLGVIRALGEDAAQFLHGQLTNDFVLLDLQHARLAAFCTAKGRMLASFIGFKRGPDEILLLCDRSLLAPTLKRLSMFVLRAKCKLSDATADFTLHGLAGDVAGNAPPWSMAQDGEVHRIALYPAAGQPRALRVAPLGAPLPQGPALSEAEWLWSEVASGIATLSAPVADAFVPQMLNYESVGGVNFKKGCYPGQEVVARSQFRGTLKRRACIVHAQQPLATGMEVFTPEDLEQATGTVVQAAPAPAGGWDAIVSMQIASAGQPLLAHAAVGEGQQADATQAVALQPRPLPYVLRDDI